jgi:hypothetical protein
MEHEHFPKEYNYFRWGNNTSHYSFYVKYRPRKEDCRIKFSWRQHTGLIYEDNSTDWFEVSVLSKLVKFASDMSRDITFSEFIIIMPYEIKYSFSGNSCGKNHVDDVEDCKCNTKAKAMINISENDSIGIEIKWKDNKTENDYIFTRHMRDNNLYKLHINIVELALLARTTLASIEADD